MHEDFTYEMPYTIRYDDGREELARGIQVGRFGVRRLPTELECWVVDHIPTGLRLIQPTSFQNAMLLADDVSRFAVEDPEASDTRVLSKQLGEKVCTWVNEQVERSNCGAELQSYRRFYGEAPHGN